MAKGRFNKTKVVNEHQMKVTLVSGFLGSGKTSLLTNVLTQKDPKMKCAVICNEISEFNVDALAMEGAHLLQSEEKMVEMSNGCICCTLREDLLEQLQDLHAQGFDAALIESSGIAEPMQVAETFFFPYPAPGSKRRKTLLQFTAPLDNCVTVVDAGTLLQHMQSIGSTHLLDKSARGTDDERNIATLMFDQLEFANVVLLNKVDVIEKAAAVTGKGKSQVTVDTLTQLIKKVNPYCEVIPTKFSKVPLDKILSTGNFTEEFTTKTQGWMDDVKTGLKHTPETEEYGVSSMSFTPKRAFHPKRLWDWIQEHFVLEEYKHEDDAQEDGDDESDGEDSSQGDDAQPTKTTDVPTEAQAAANDAEEDAAWAKEVAARRAKRTQLYGNLFRGKGYAWIGSPKRNHIFGMWGQAGDTLTFGGAGSWDEFPQNNSSEPVSVDPGQRLIFIGQDLKRDALTADLEKLLLTTEESALLTNAMSLKLDEGQENRERADVFEDPWAPFEAAQACPIPKTTEVGKKRARKGEEQNDAGAPPTKKQRRKK